MAASTPTSTPKSADVDATGTKSAKRERFEKLAQARTVNAIKAIRFIGKLANESSYEYDEGDVRKIAKALNDEVTTLTERLKAARSSGDVDFKL